jgi:hypothetical protein
MKTKTSINKREQKQIDAVVNSHPDKLTQIVWDAEAQVWCATFVETLNVDAMENESLDDLIVDALEAAAAALEEAGEEESLDDDSDDVLTKTIVPHKYRSEYKARGDARCCGDWLAITLRNLLNGGSKKNPVNLDLTYKLARANGCDKQWPSLNPGQQRMNAGNAIRRAVKAAGFLVIPASMSSDGSEQRLYP